MRTTSLGPTPQEQNGDVIDGPGLSERSARPRLTPRREKFVLSYLANGENGAAAARDAGYSPKGANVTASKLLAIPIIHDAIRYELDRQRERLELTADSVLQRLVIESTYFGSGASHGARVTALGLLAKHFGLLIERQQIDSRYEIIIRRSDGSTLPLQIGKTSEQIGNAPDP